MISGKNSGIWKNSGNIERHSEASLIINIILTKSTYIPYAEAAGHSGIAPGDLVVLSADLTRMAMLALRKEGNFDVRIFIEGFQDFLGPEGTLVIPSFNFNLRNNDPYSRIHTLPITGSLAQAALKWTDFQRTANPLHSFLAWGKHAGDLVRLDNKSSFGPGSPFAFFREHHAVMLLADIHIRSAFTFVHHVEEMEQVRYRKMKKINIFLEDEKKHEEYLLFAKKPGWTMEMSGLETLLLEQSVAQKVMINNLFFTKVGLAAAYPVIRHDILQNRAASIARFSGKLYLRDMAKKFLDRLGVYTVADKISHDPGVL
ncbi:MAG: AAC(3) family N-acetyltransferase [Bacteroidales bacterium]|nr:AAC(3) family N-acetyltransferase [Bacteroidales bacterium]